MSRAQHHPIFGQTSERKRRTFFSVIITNYIKIIQCLPVEAPYYRDFWNSEDFGRCLESGKKGHQLKKPVSCLISELMIMGVRRNNQSETVTLPNRPTKG